MELPDVGQQCSYENCKQLDFLPLRCQCNNVFCPKHLNIHIQTCVASKSLSEDQLKKIENVLVCSKEDCKERSVIPLICKKCKKHFCIQHRHLTECREKSKEELEIEKEKFSEPIRKFNEAKAVVDNQIAENLSRAGKKSKNKEMAAQVQLMKIKNKAVGQKTIPSTDRVYFNIHYGVNYTKSLAVFVSKTWSLGRVTDAITVECKLQNNNNKSTEKKLRLFKHEGNTIVSNNMSCNLDKLLNEHSIVNGENLVIAYVDDHCMNL
ncbi:AN1-type zinc finger protein 1-like [Sitophilus oryzae]|uniref:AN1-type zinc finger protein 1-like n=1 Tax=Sitophilus oryzae TaxID=7048 RepID=A0A6J2XHV8_SITOR|nr:AN1-type zinc finger protein 1-like [Sitophilus oryzae]